MTTESVAAAERTLLYLSSSPMAGSGDPALDSASSHLLSALRPYCSNVILAVASESSGTGLETSKGNLSILHFEGSRGLLGALEALDASIGALSSRYREDKSILVVSDSLLGPLASLGELFDFLNEPGLPIRLLSAPDPAFSGEQGTEDLALEPMLIQIAWEAFRSPGFHSALGVSGSITELLNAAEKSGFKASFMLEAGDDEYFLRSSVSKLPLIPWAVFTSDPLLLERWAVSARGAYDSVARSDYPLDLFWDHLTHAAPPQTWYTNLALLDIPHGDVNELPRNTLKSAVCAHVFYPDMVAEMLHYASNVPSPVTFIATTDTPQKKAELETIIEADPHAHHFEKVEVRVVATNDGRDISAFLVDCGDVIRDPGFDLIVKMHSKRSVQDPQSVSSWFRKHLFENLFASPAHVSHIYNRFATEPQLGMVFPPVIHMGLPTMGNGWTANRLPAETLAPRLGIDIPFDSHTPLSPYGSMFISRREALLPLVEADFRPDEFPTDGDYRDGSLAHVLERLYSYVIYSQGFFSRCVQTPELAAISAVTLEYKLDTTSSYLHPHVLEQVKMFGSGAASGPSLAAVRSLMQRSLSSRFPRLGASLTSTWMAGKAAKRSAAEKLSSLRGKDNN